MKRKPPPQPGERFGRLTVIRSLSVDSRGIRHMLCRCDCGVTKSVTSQAMRRGTTVSCGCRKREFARSGASSRKHGLSRSRNGARDPRYQAWAGMIGRCGNPNNAKYHRYGGRGIRVCARWRASFEAFAADIGAKPTPHHTLGRIDNDGDYEPNNCRWELPAQQSLNKSNNVRITAHGETLTLSQWEKRTGLKRLTIAWRLRRGWPTERLLEPVRGSL